MKAFFSAALTICAASSTETPARRRMEQTRPGVFRIPMEKVHVPSGEHPQLEAGNHPRVGNWSDSELWDREVKSPVNNLDNYMYTMPCTIGGTYSGTMINDQSRCVFDTTTSISSTF